MRPKSYAVVLDGTNAVNLQLPACRVLEIVPGGTVTITARMGDGNDGLPLSNGSSYSSPSTGDTVDAMTLRLTATSATTCTVIQWV